MGSNDSFPSGAFWQRESFGLIKAEDFDSLGIDPEDIPFGTVAAHRHPSYLPSRFGGNAYGLGLFELQVRLKPRDVKLLNSVTFHDSESIKSRYKELNEIYKKVGLLIRFSSMGRPYYLIPVRWASESVSHIMSKVDHIVSVVGSLRKKHLKEHLHIGILSHADDLILQELSFRLKEHRVTTIDSLEKLQATEKHLDLVVVTRDMYEIVLLEEFSPVAREMVTKKRVDQYAIFILWKLFNLLTKEGEIFIISNYYAAKTNQTTKVVFRTKQEAKKFALFSHIFKTKKKYKPTSNTLQINVFDFQNYLSDLYVEEEIFNRLLGGKSPENLTLEQINNLPYMDFKLSDWKYLSDQERNWNNLLSKFFDELFLEPFIPQPVKEGWDKRFSCADHSPHCMIRYLGQKKTQETMMEKIHQQALESNLIGCPRELLAEYRNSFDYVIRTLEVLKEVKEGTHRGIPQLYSDRLRQPFENRNRRFNSLNDILKLMGRIKRLENIKSYLNPDLVEGPKTRVIENLEALTFFGFSKNELREILYIVLSHTPMGRIIAGKMSEKTLKPFTDAARSYDLPQALNLLRYCRLMTMAETEAARRSELTLAEYAELFELYESAVRIVTNRELDWDTLLDEKNAAMGGIHNAVIRKLLKMINHFEFLDNWPELRHKGLMEKEALADYDSEKLSGIENTIRLVSTVEQFERMYLKSGPLHLPVFYRSLLNTEFHGTGQVFERMGSRLVYTLLWLTVHVSRGDVINFNPILSNLAKASIDARVKKVEREARSINVHYLEYPVLKNLREQLYEHKASFVVGTGFQLRVNALTQSVEVYYLDMDKDIAQMENLMAKIAGSPISRIDNEDLTRMETLFSNLESFYQSHLRLTDKAADTLKLPSRQRGWFERVKNLREKLQKQLLGVLFLPDTIYTDLHKLYESAPSILRFSLPEFSALEDYDVSGHLYLKSPPAHYIIATARKLQALITRDRTEFQNMRLLHRLAQEEFGPLATGTVGVNEQQISELEKIIERCRENAPLFDALVKSFVLQDLGRVPALSSKYRTEVNPADLAQAGAFFLKREKIAARYNVDGQAEEYLIFLIRHHGLLHHIIRGEYSFSAIEDAIDPKDVQLFDAFFLLSFIMLSAIREDLMREDLADQLFSIRTACEKTIQGHTTLKDQMEEMYAQRGNLFSALESYQRDGLPEGTTPSSYLDSMQWQSVERPARVRAGRMIFATERLLRMRGIRHVQFYDLVAHMMRIPSEFIYKKKRFSSIGHATFEKELFESLRIYNTLQNLPEKTRHFILDYLVDDNVRIFWFEKVSGYISYENQIKLLLLSLLGAKMIGRGSGPVFLDFFHIGSKIPLRYEVVNDHLNALSIAGVWSDKRKLNRFFKADTGLVLKKEQFPRVLSVDFKDRVNLDQKTAHMNTMDNVEQLKNYFHYSLRSLRESAFYTDDYELQLEDAFERRLVENTDVLLNQAEQRMNLIKEFEELSNFVRDLLDRSLEIGFSEDQQHRLNDMYELRKDALKREKLSEIKRFLDSCHDTHELMNYWNSIKWYLQENRKYFGQEFEITIARRFDAAMGNAKD